MNRVILFPLVVSAFAFSASGCKTAKSKCSLTVQQAPAIKGIRLGMTPTELNSVLPKLSLSDSAGGGFANTEIEVQGTAHPELKGIKELEIGFFEGTIDKIKATYEDSGGWSSPEEFRAQMYETHNLPYEEHFIGPNDVGTRMISCDGFFISVGMLELGIHGNVPNIYLQDMRRSTRARERRRN